MSTRSHRLLLGPTPRGSLWMSLVVLFLVMLLSPLSRSMFEDEFGQRHWHQRYLTGTFHRVLFASPPSRLMVVLSGNDRRIVSALNVRTGHVAWKRTFDMPIRDVFLGPAPSKSGSSYVFVLPQVPGTEKAAQGPSSRIMMIELEGGKLIQEFHVHDDADDANAGEYGVVSVWHVRDVLGSVSGKRSRVDFVAALTSDGSLQFRQVSLKTKKASRKKKNTDGLPCGELQLLSVDTNGGSLVPVAVVGRRDEVGDLTDDVDVALVSEDLSELTFQSFSLDDEGCWIESEQSDASKFETPELASLVEDEEFPSIEVDEFGRYVVFRSGSGAGGVVAFDVVETRLVTVSSERKTEVPVSNFVPGAYVVASDAQGGVLEIVSEEDGVVTISVSGHGDIKRVFVQSFALAQTTRRKKSKKTQTKAFRVFVACADGSFLAFKNKDQIWSRDDGLGDVEPGNALIVRVRAASSEDVDVRNPVSRLMAQGGWLAQLARALADLDSWKGLLQHLPFGLGKRWKGLGTKKRVNADYGDSKLGIEHLLIVLTPHGRLYALSVATGETRWSIFDETLQMAQSTRLYNIGTEVVIVAATSELTRVMHVGASRGKIRSDVSMEMQLRHHFVAEAEESGSDVLVLLDENLDVRTVPKKEAVSGFAYYEAVASDGVVVGMTVPKTKSGPRRKMWTRNFESEIVGFSSGRRGEGVSYLYDLNQTEPLYINPSLVVLVVRTSENSLTCYVLDGATGEIIHHALHEDAVPPVTLLAVDANSFVYAYRNTKLDHFQLTLLEAFAPKEETEGKSRSKLNHHGKVEQESFFLPYAVGPGAVTRTREGQTSNNVLFALPSQHAILSIERHFLNTRRPPTADMNAVQAGTALPMYHPFLPPVFITLNVSVQGTVEVVSYPTGFESTTQVAAVGSDFFYARYCPSMNEVCFDTIPPTFDKGMIVFVCILLVFVAMGVRWYSNRNVLQGAWR